jgi:hypothetical protein
MPAATFAQWGEFLADKGRKQQLRHPLEDE